MGDEELRIGLLGAFSISKVGDAVADGAWRLRKAKALVKLLALAPEQRLHAEQVTELLWGDRPAAAARNNLHQAVFAARRALDSAGIDGRRYLDFQDGVIALAPGDPVRIDAVAFERAAELARADRDVAAHRAAVDLYGGELLPEDRYEEWTASRRESLRELQLGLGVELAELEATADRAAAIGRLRAVLVDAPLHEPAHRALMRLYAGEGRRQEALAQFQQLKRALRREFEDEPDDETRRLYQEILTRSLAPRPAPPEPGSAGAPAGPPRQLASFVGRERELGEVRALLGSARLLTLTGAGGCGKTRLAFELAGQRSGEFAEGVVAVELAALAERALIGPAVARAMDVRLASDRAPEVALAGHIGSRAMLLLLDNCEHLVEPVAHLVEALLLRCPNLTVLATSREPLRVAGEVTWRVPSLSLPRLGDGVSPQESLEAEAVRLFAVRARQSLPGFELSEENAGAVAALCHRLDGMPLAIELAAARVGVLTPSQIVDRLDNSLDLLSSGDRNAMTRQQTLRATLAWSFELLEPGEQVLLRRLSVFAGGFGLEAAEDVCAEPPLQRREAIALLGRLVDKSLVQVEGDGDGRRHRLLETVRQYAAERLDQAGERTEFEGRHRDWYLELAEGDPTPAGDLPAPDRLRLLDGEDENLRAALTSALADDPQAGLRLAVALWRFWLMRGYLAEGYGWLTAVLDAATERTPARAAALRAACLIGLRRGVHERIPAFAAESVEILDELGERAAMFDSVEVFAAYLVIFGAEGDAAALVERHEAESSDAVLAARPPTWAAHTRGAAAWLRREYRRAGEHFETALELAAPMAGERRPALWPLSCGLISVEAEVGYPLLMHEETVLVARRVGGEAALAYILADLAAVERVEGDFERARELVEESLARFRHLGDRLGEAFALNAAGNLARAGGDFERGRALLEEALELRQRVGDRRGTGITLGCLAFLRARAGDPAAGRAAAQRARGWFVENDDLIGLSAAELSLACVALSAADEAAALAHLEEAVSVLDGLESTHQEGWALAVLAAICAERGDVPAGRGWLDRARRRFEQLGGEAGLAYCRALERSPALAGAASGEGA